MHTIDVDFDAYKQLTVLRTTEDVSYNDVIRELLGLGPTKTILPSEVANSSDDWVVKGVRFPVSTEFRANHKGQMYVARAEKGALVLNGQRFGSPSKAAGSVTRGSVNGWRFWECRLPGKSSWQLIESLRR